MVDDDNVNSPGSIPAAPVPLPYAQPRGAEQVPAPAAVLSPEHLQQIKLAQQRATKVRRAMRVAQFDGWATGIFGGITFLCGFSGSLVALVLGAGMLIVAFIEFKGAARLRKFDPGAPRVLALNQVYFGALLLAYAAWSLWGVFHNQSELSSALASAGDLGQLGIDAAQIERTIGLLVYGALACVAIFGQGGTALYYWTRRRFVDAYLRETPQWIIDAQRAGLPI